MEAKVKNITIFLIGGLGYGFIETIFRGFTHWTMLVAGGVCFIIIYHLNARNEKAPLWQKCLAGALIITLIEFTVGCIVNLWLGWNVWSYSRYTYNVLGQICLPFTVMWFLLCFPLFFFTKYLRARFVNTRLSRIH